MPENRSSAFDRRSGSDRRKAYRLGFFNRGAVERRAGKERRATAERRLGWVRIGKWDSARLDGLKISKFLKRSTSRKNV